MKLPKGVRKLTKERFTTEVMKYQEEKEIPFLLAVRTYEAWTPNGQKKSAKTTYRW